MALPELDKIFASNACRGAFQITDGQLVSLTGNDPAVIDDAQRTKELWSSLAAFVPDLGTVIAKRETGVSIASKRGGVILEASAPVNIGILRAALRNEMPIELQEIEPIAFDVGGTRALWTLANWIEGTETGRAMRVRVGEETLKIWARKGQFGLAEDVAPEDIANTILSVNESGAPVTLEYDVLQDDAPDAIHAPLALFVAGQSEVNEWHFDMMGAPTARPSDVSLHTTGLMLGLHAHLKSWGAGQPFEVTILREEGPPQVVANGGDPADIRIMLSGHI